MKKYSVRIRIFDGADEYATATFELLAKNQIAARYRVFNLFNNETIRDGDGISIIEVQEIRDV